MRPAAPLLPPLEANSFEDLPGKWQAAILDGAEQAKAARRDPRLSRLPPALELSHARPAAA
jgi:hypothetical protein